MEDQQYKALFGELKSIKEEVQATRDEVARIDRDLCKDREDLENFRVHLGHVVEQIDSLKRLSTSNVTNMQDQVTDALKPAVKEVSSLKQEIKKKKFITIFKTGLWERIKNWFVIKEIKKEIKGGE
jgi:hypothetical protein